MTKGRMGPVNEFARPLEIDDFEPPAPKVGTST